jgi:hypothetical protein
LTPPPPPAPWIPHWVSPRVPPGFAPHPPLLRPPPSSPPPPLPPRLPLPTDPVPPPPVPQGYPQVPHSTSGGPPWGAPPSPPLPLSPHPPFPPFPALGVSPWVFPPSPHRPRVPRGIPWEVSTPEGSPGLASGLVTRPGLLPGFHRPTAPPPLPQTSPKPAPNNPKPPPTTPNPSPNHATIIQTIPKPCRNHPQGTPRLGYHPRPGPGYMVQPGLPDMTRLHLPGYDPVTSHWPVRFDFKTNP